MTKFHGTGSRDSLSARLSTIQVIFGSVPKFGWVESVILVQLTLRNFAGVKSPVNPDHLNRSQPSTKSDTASLRTIIEAMVIISGHTFVISGGYEILAFTTRTLS